MTETASPWTPDEAAYARLLSFLDADPERAAPKFDEVRRRLLKLFAWRNCAPPEMFARRTIDRVARRITEGNDRHVAEPFQYFYGVAMNVLKEGGSSSSSTIEPTTPPADSPDSQAPREVDPAVAAAARQRLTCIESCLGELLPKHRALLLDYHRSATDGERCDELAEMQGIPLNALRLRVHRLRASVERSVTRCLARVADRPAEAPQ